jgi:hypothetical protein
MRADARRSFSANPPNDAVILHRRIALRSNRVRDMTSGQRADHARRGVSEDLSDARTTR